jgi:hypothetical protein
MLAFARKAPLSKKGMDVQVLIDEIAEELQAEFRERGVRLVRKGQQGVRALVDEASLPGGTGPSCTDGPGRLPGRTSSHSVYLGGREMTSGFSGT